MAAFSLSVVIICRNAALTIEKVIQGALSVSNDVVVIDSGSTDGTTDKIRRTGVRLVETTWRGYGATKNYGNALAVNDWILSLDADEYIDDILAESIHKADFSDETVSYRMKRINYLGSHPIRFGEWGKGSGFVHRIFNRINVAWDDSPVHENLVFRKAGPVKNLAGTLHHYTSPDIASYQQKLYSYAELMADKYRLKGKKASIFSLLLSPAFNFIKSYLVKGGFLDGRDGWTIARANARYTFRKYQLLRKIKS
jgi:glycosyltransferase involved in cell wall biosynthesis